MLCCEKTDGITLNAGIVVVVVVVGCWMRSCMDAE